MITAKRRGAEFHADEAKPKPVCVHYWLIETEKGPTSAGFCERCGETRAFSNVLPDRFDDYRRRPAENKVEIPTGRRLL